MRLFPGGGAPKPPQLHYDMKEEMGGVGICSGYGLTEAPILVLVDVDDSDEVKAETEGQPMPGVELKLVTLDGSVAGSGEEGEIRAKAPQMMRGYLDSSLDEEAFDEDGWFRTGDLGEQRRRRQPDHHRPAQGHHHPQHGEHLGQGGRGPALRAPAGR